MLEALFLGAVAGYAIAMPVGPIAVLILRTGMRDGRAAALAAGAGCATADLIYATAAMLAGPPLVTLIAPALRPARLLAAVLLLFLAIRGLRAAEPAAAARESVAPRRTYLTVLGLTLLNPSTVIYFASLAVGLPTIAIDPLARALFILAAAAASLSWQSLLAVAGSSLHGRATPRMSAVTAGASALIIGALALKIAADALTA